MKRPAVGTKEDFQRYMDAQIKLYAAHVAEAYGLPDPRSVHGVYWQVAELIDAPELTVSNAPPTEYVKTRNILFHKVYWRTQEGQNFLYWERMDK